MKFRFVPYVAATALIALLVPGLANGGVFFLSETGNDANDGSSWGNAFATLATALTHANSDGSIVNIAAGTYQVTSAQQLSAGVILRGATGNPADVIIERPSSSYNHRVFDLNNAGAILESLTIQGGCADDTYAYGGGVYIHEAGGVVTNCILRGNRTQGKFGGGSALWCASTAGILTHCVISNNTTSVYSSNDPGGPVCMEHGRVDNCLVTGHVIDKEVGSDKALGGMIALNFDAIAENCTVVRNYALGCAGITIRGSGNYVRVRNCVIAGNTSASGGSLSVWRIQKDGHENLFTNCVSDAHAPNQWCHAGHDVTFMDAAHGDWRPTVSSAAVDIGGTVDNPSSLDLAGNPRHVDALDAGCYELQKSGGLMAGLSVNTSSAFAPAAVVFTASVSGVDAEDVIKYQWDFDNDGVIDDVTNEGTVTNIYTASGLYSVSVTVVDMTTDETTKTTLTDAFRANPKTLYVISGNAGAAEPYDTLATAAASVQTAVDYAVAGAEVVIAPGTYSLPGEVFVDREITLRGATGRPEDVILDGRNSVRCLRLNAGRGGLVHSLTLQNGYVNENWTYGGGAYVHASGGTISNCIVRGCHSGSKYGACGGLYADCDNALFTHCVITNNTASTGNRDDGIVSGLAVHLNGAARLEHSLVAKNHYTGGWCESTVYVKDGAVRFCTIIDNQARDFGGVNLAGTQAEVKGCIIAGNTSYWSDADRYKVWGAGTLYASESISSDDGSRATPAMAAQISKGAVDAVLVNDTCHQASLEQLLPRYVAQNNVMVGPEAPARNAIAQRDAGSMPALDLFGHPRLYGSQYDIGAVESMKATAFYLIME